MQDGITRDQALSDKRLYSLMQFMMGPKQDIYNWREIRSLGMVSTCRSMTLYRGLNKCKPADVDLTPTRCTSWSRSKSVAEWAAGECGVILTCTFDRQFLVFDTRFLHVDLFAGKHMWQQEVIVRPLRKAPPTRIEPSEFHGDEMDIHVLK